MMITPLNIPYSGWWCLHFEISFIFNFFFLNIKYALFLDVWCFRYVLHVAKEQKKKCCRIEDLWWRCPKASGWVTSDGLDFVFILFSSFAWKLESRTPFIFFNTFLYSFCILWSSAELIKFFFPGLEAAFVFYRSDPNFRFCHFLILNLILQLLLLLLLLLIFRPILLVSITWTST